MLPFLGLVVIKILSLKGGKMSDKKSLLFVDDEEEILDILVDIFSDQDYNIHTATKAEEALDIVNKNSVDFVISDLKLPDSTGIELLCKIAQKNPDAVRVLTSGYLDVKFGGIFENREDGTLYLSKPWDMLILKKLVTDRLGQ